MAAKTFNISLPAELVKRVDAAAKASYASRSDYIRQALVQALDGASVPKTKALTAQEAAADERLLAVFEDYRQRLKAAERQVAALQRPSSRY